MRLKNSSNDSIIIGVLGGMGTYATIHLFEQYASTFPAEKEWDRPRIIIDNNCTMPSRVRAFLYNENVDLLVDQMTKSLCNLVNSGANRIILACNTSHLFLPMIYKRAPELKDKIINIIDVTVNKIKNNSINSVYLLASEGTIESKVYSEKLSKKCVLCNYPQKKDYDLLRTCIEAVKQNRYNEYSKNAFLKLLDGKSSVILGCTELPILYEKYKAEVNIDNVFDPIQISLSTIKLEMER